MCPIGLVFIVAFSLVNAQSKTTSDIAAAPPQFITDFDKYREMLYSDQDAYETFYNYLSQATKHTLTCEAKGTPQPTYEWHRNGKKITDKTEKESYFDPTVEGRVARLTISMPEYADQIRDVNGLYQCMASNTYGVAISREIKLTSSRAASQSDRESVARMRVNEHEHVVLTCRGQWMEKTFPGRKYEWREWMDRQSRRPSDGPILDKDNRVAIDQEGSLHFINIKVDDGLGYTCGVSNGESSTVNYGSNVRLNVTKATKVDRAATIAYSSKNNQQVMMEGIVKFQCIPDGIPIPKIEWYRLERKITSSARITISDFGRVLTIKPIEEDDKGSYECRTRGGTGASKKVVFTITVVSLPIWVRKPLPQTLVEGAASAKFVCDARSANNHGSVRVTWYKNGAKLRDGKYGKMQISGNEVSIANVQKTSSIVVLQCNVSNKYGYRFANAQLNVISETKYESNMVPRRLVLAGDDVDMKVVPKPDPLFTDVVKLKWSKDGKMITNQDKTKSPYISGHILYVATTADMPNADFHDLMGKYKCTIDVGVPIAEVDVKMVLTNVSKIDVPITRKDTFWTPSAKLGVISGCVIVLILLVILVLLMYRRHERKRNGRSSGSASRHRSSHLSIDIDIHGGLKGDNQTEEVWDENTQKYQTVDKYGNVIDNYESKKNYIAQDLSQAESGNLATGGDQSVSMTMTTSETKRVTRRKRKKSDKKSDAYGEPTYDSTTDTRLSQSRHKKRSKHGEGGLNQPSDMNVASGLGEDASASMGGVVLVRHSRSSHKKRRAHDDYEDPACY